MNRREETGREQTHSHNHFKLILISLCLISISMITWKAVYAIQPDLEGSSTFHQTDSGAFPQVNLRAASGMTTPFIAQNNLTSNEQPTGMQDIPHLVLYRNGELTSPAERTLDVTLSNLEVPAGGITVTMRLETQHGDPDPGGGDCPRISVWQESRRIDNNLGDSQAMADTPLSEASLAEASFHIEFGQSSTSAQGIIPTPTDFYRLEVQVLDASKPTAKPLFSTKLNHAFLLEHQWVAPLNNPDSSSAAGPQELVVYACDMFPFQRDSRDASSKMLRNAVPGYIETELLPKMIDAIHLQTEVWGFSLTGWVSFGDSRNSQRLEVALSDGQTWYHAPVPDRGNSAIAINVNGGDNAEYDTLTDGLMSTLHHELFHNLQRAIAITNSGSGDVDGRDGAWQFFAEGMASFVPSVAQPEIQFTQSREARAYSAKAVQFVGGRGFPGELNASYADVNPYHGAMYWRFLYEQCGGFSEGIENPAAGMGVMRRALQVLYSGEIVDINASTDLVQRMPTVMDRVLTSPEAAGCPFHSYTDSLTSFARAIYTLRLRGGRRAAPGVPEGCSFYDPASLYSGPHTSMLSYTGIELEFSSEDQPYPAGIKSSFGMDFIDLQLQPEVNGQPLTIELYAQAQGGAQYHVQLLKLQKLGGSGMSSQRMVQVSPPEMLRNEVPDATLSLSIPAVELDTYNRIGIIITRVDAREHLDPVGAYTLVVNPGR
jgi:hypothetical protein